MAKKKKHFKSIDEMTHEEWEKRLNDFWATQTPDDRAMTKVDPRFTERHDGQTPSGGDYSIAYYYDEDGSPCIKEQAKSVNIVEYDNDGNRINETYGILGE